MIIENSQPGVKIRIYLALIFFIIAGVAGTYFNIMSTIKKQGTGFCPRLNQTLATKALLQHSVRNHIHKLIQEAETAWEQDEFEDQVSISEFDLNDQLLAEIIQSTGDGKQTATEKMRLSKINPENIWGNNDVIRKAIDGKSIVYTDTRSHYSIIYRDFSITRIPYQEDGAKASLLWRYRGYGNFVLTYNKRVILTACCERLEHTPRIGRQLSKEPVFESLRTPPTRVEEYISNCGEI